MDRAYHGGLLYFGHGGEALLAPFDFQRLRFNDAEGVDAIEEQVAAVLVEPMMGAAGCIASTPSSLPRCADDATTSVHSSCSTR